jgi:hypothetical protein
MNNITETRWQEENLVSPTNQETTDQREKEI